MKKRLIAILLCAALAVLTGCEQEPAITTSPTNTETQESVQDTTVETTESTQAIEETTEPETEPSAPDAHPSSVGIYIPAEDGTAARALVTEFTAKRIAKTDIDCFEVIASHADRVEGGSFRNIWSTAWDAHADSETGKIGFHIEFILDSGEIISKQLLKPGDAKSFFEYLEIYMYDDIHQTPGVWYTHLEDTDITEETVISSIKLTAGSEIDQVGDIILTAFIYNGPAHFDAQGKYIGDTSATVIISE